MRSRPTALALTALAVLLAQPALAKPKSGRLTAMAIPGGPVEDLVAGGADPDRFWAQTGLPADDVTFWRSDDAGRHWVRLSEHRAAGRLLLPSRHDRDVLYATDATREVDGAVPIYRSEDGGVTFARIDDGSLRSSGLRCFVADPFSALELRAGGEDGLWVSTNGGVSWFHQAASPSPLTQLAAPDQVGRLWATGSVDGNTLWLSTDGGASWRRVETPAGANGTIGTMTSAPSGSGVALFAYKANDDPAHVFVSDDVGASWVDLGAPATTLEGLVAEQGAQPALWALAPSTLGSELFRRAAGDADWVAASPGGGTVNDFVAPAGGTLLSATASGIRRWIDGRWVAADAGPWTPAVTTLAVAAAGPPWVFAGTADGLWRGLTSGESWVRVELPAGSGDAVSSIAVPPKSVPDALYVAVAYRSASSEGQHARVLRSNCLGCSWQDADSGLPADRTLVGELAIDPTNSDVVWAVVFAGTAGEVWRTHDGGRSWQAVRQGIEVGDSVQRIAIAPDDPELVLAGAMDGSIYRWRVADDSWQESSGIGLNVASIAAVRHGVSWATGLGSLGTYPAGYLVRSQDAGLTWESAPAPFTGAFAAPWGLDLVGDDPRQIWVANYSFTGDRRQSGLWRSRDGGATYEQVITKLYPTSVAVFPDDRGVAFLGTRNGLYRWIDACEPDAETLCLDGGRMRVEGSWQNRYDGSAGRVRVRQQSDATGVLAFSDLANPELIVKTIDLGRPRPEIFVGQLTDLDWEVRITDTKTGERRVITNHDDVCKPAAAETAPIAPGACVAGADTLCLLNGRLRIRATWDNQYDGSHGLAGTLPYSPLASWLTFVDPTLPELLLKALDFGDRTLLYWGALTDLGYQLTVDDLRTGVARRYTNAPGQRCGGSDTWPTP